MSVINITHGRTQQIADQGLGEYAEVTTTPGLARIYERLRKASYRRSQRFDAILDAWLDGKGEYPTAEEWYESDDHLTYLRGVRDALNAVAGRS